MWYPGLIIHIFTYVMRLRQQFFQRIKYLCNKTVFQCMIELLLVVQEFYNVRCWAVKDFYCWMCHTFWTEEKQIVGLWRWLFCLEFKECTGTCQGYWWQNLSKVIYIYKQGTENRSSCLNWFLPEDL